MADLTDVRFVRGLVEMMAAIAKMDDDKQSHSVEWVKKVLTDFVAMGYDIREMSELLRQRQMSESRPKV